MKCLIDCSQFRSSVLDYEIIHEAVTGYHRDSTRTMKLIPADEALYEDAGWDALRTMSDLSEEDLDNLRYLAEEALDFLNEGSEDTQGYFFLEDNCLYWDEWGDEGDEDECQGHESTNGPIGNVEFCDGSCRPQVRKFN